ncbi:cell division protein PerM [Phycicoccus ginsengisoli]
MTVMELLRGETTGRGGVDPVGLRRAALAGAGAAAVSACVFVLPALLVWVAAAQSTVPWTAALGVGASLWLLGGGAHLDVAGTSVTVVPLLFLLLAVLGAAWSAGRATFDAAHDREPRLVRGLVHRRLLADLGAWTGGYVVCAALWWVAAALAGPTPVVWTVALPVLVLPVVAALLALGRHVRRRPELVGEAMRRPGWLPAAVPRGVRAGLEGAGALLGSGVLACVLMFVLHFDRVAHLQSELAPGVVGGVVLVVAQLAVLPNLALWAVSFLAGTGFSAVEGASATWTGSRTSVLPMVPVLGALPEPGAFPGALPLVVLVPVLVGVLVGWRALRSVSRLSTQGTKLAVVGVAVAVTAGAVGLLDVVGGSSLGSARLAHIGAPAGAMTLALLVEVALGAVLVLGWDRWKLRR